MTVRKLLIYARLMFICCDFQPNFVVPQVNGNEWSWKNLNTAGPLAPFLGPCTRRTRKGSRSRTWSWTPVSKLKTHNTPQVNHSYNYSCQCSPTCFRMRFIGIGENPSPIPINLPSEMFVRFADVFLERHLQILQTLK